jgi:hypothetical protein
MFELIRSQQATPNQSKTKNANSAKIANPIGFADRLARSPSMA